MRSKGINPDVISYNALIKGFCNDGKSEEALYVEYIGFGCFEYFRVC